MVLESLLNQLRDELKRKIILCIPNMSKTASLITKAIKENTLKLKYLKMIPRFASQHNYLNFMGDVYLITKHLKELRPSVLQSDTYGDGTIKRINISIGEILRLNNI